MIKREERFDEERPLPCYRGLSSQNLSKAVEVKERFGEER